MTDFSTFGDKLFIEKYQIDISESTASLWHKYFGERGHCLKDRMFNCISDIRENKGRPVSTHFNNADNIYFGEEENMILYSVEQIPDQDNAQRNESLICTRELHWIKPWSTQFLI